MSNRRWGYGISQDTEMWFGTFPCKQGAIDEGRKEYGEEVGFWVCSGPMKRAHEFTPLADEFAERMSELAADECGEVSEGWPSADLQPLMNLIDAWFEAFDPPEFWLADGKPEMVLPR